MLGVAICLRKNVCCGYNLHDIVSNASATDEVLIITTKVGENLQSIDDDIIINQQDYELRVLVSTKLDKKTK